ncbi:zinc-dependent alcohol dehydrogenase family protein [Agaribacter marinus]|uniref:Quinone oxidoreductase n=1 Tax=Agaribacter marinus TaxID=1431249 RepID=A0AA37T128_9ALTE|nr:zinc-dependent alcohol dehydrogenase family protein [Agaribacter marinus]GLR73101.1 quinone oxidoreductase [Agaribacter marinus]
MKAMILNEFGGPEVFEEAEVPKPKIKAGHVLVKIAATSVNTVDTMIRQMGPELPLSPATPAILGMDFAGIVCEVGDSVNGYNVGDEVYGCAGGLADLQGTLAEYIVADVKLVALKPNNLSMLEAAALPLVGITAYEGLMRAGIQRGQNVLVHGGTGGVGHIALQLAKYFGANVFSTGGGEPQLQLIQQLGATAINYRTDSVESYVQQYTDGSGFEVVFDSVGGANMTNSFHAAALNAHVVSTVSLLELDLSPAHFKGLSLHVVFMLIPMLHDHKREEHAAILKSLTSIVEAGALKPILDDTSFSFTDIGKAHERLASGRAVGKVVVSVN